MSAFVASKPVIIALGGAAVAILAMAVLVAKYLFDTYIHTSIIVAVLATLVVVATAVIPCLVQSWRCAREERRNAQSH